MKTILSLSIFLTLTFLGFSQQEDVARLKEDVKTAKDELRNQLGNKKYDGSKTTYFEVGSKNDFKDVEVVLFLRDSYELFFSGKAAGAKVRMRIYDKASDKKDRVMLYEVKNIGGKIEKVSAKELNEVLNFHYPQAGALKSVFVEYEIMKGKPHRGAIVMALGY
jgi:hypothetical protein